MTLCDTGPLVALADADDPYHARCAAAATRLPPSPMMTTWPCLTEAMHMLNRVGGISAQDRLWSLLSNGSLHLYLPHLDEWQRIHELMRQYADMPLDLADASLVSAAEQTREHFLFSIDRGLRAVRLSDGSFFDIVP